MFKRTLLLLLLLLTAVLLPVAPAGADDLGLTVSPEQIDIGLNFKGATLNIKGNAPPGSQIYVKVESPPGTVTLNRKGKVGPFWMTVDHVQAENIPKIYEIAGSSSLAHLTPKQMDQMEIGPDYTYLREHARVTHKVDVEKSVLSPGEASDYLNGLFSMYEKRGFYLVNDNALQLGNGGFQAIVQIPSSIPPGKTKITAYAVRGNQVIASGEFPLQVNSVGMVNWVRTEATTNGPFYGLIAVIVALVVGLAVGALFSSFGHSRKGAQADSGAH